MKILIIGHGGCGKGEVAKMLAGMTGLRPSGSVSQFMTRHVAKVLGIPEEQAYAERRDHREEWASIIDDFRKGDPGKILRTLAEDGDIVDGGRRTEEFDAARHCFDMVVWVERDVPVDPTLQLSRDDADLVLDNTGSLKELESRVADLVADFAMEEAA